MNNYYVYIYLDPRKEGVYQYDDVFLQYEPFYVGKGKNNRCYFGLKDNKNTPIKTNKIKSILRGGAFPIILKIYEGLENDNASELEVETIKKIGRLDNKSGPLVNMTDGETGGNGLKHTKKWRKILSKTIIQFDINKNILAEFDSIKEASEKTGIIKQNISAVLSNRRKTSGGFIWEYKNKEDKLQGHLKKPNIMPKHSEETKEKMRKSAKIGKEHPMFGIKGGEHPSSKKIIQKDQEGNTIKIWDSMQSISNELGFTASNICRCCKGTVKRIAGYKWEYYN
jgi:hypothetical protein